MTNVHRTHNQAVELVENYLSDSIDADDVFGYSKPYDLKWNNLSLRIKVARPSKKNDRNKEYWYYTLDENKKPYIDFYILFLMDKQNKLKSVFALPKILAPTYITITKEEGNIRYSRFRTDLQDLAQKISEVSDKLPQLIKMKHEAKNYGKT